MSGGLVPWVIVVVLLLGVLVWAAGTGRPGARRGRGSRAGNALHPFPGIDITPLLNLQGIYEPGKKHLLEKQQSEEREEDDEGDPPEGGSRGARRT